MASVTVEFFGSARSRAGVAECELDADTIADVIKALAQMFPKLAETCFQDCGLADGWLFNLDGLQFTTDATLIVKSGQRLLLMTADVGG